jgi:hypothetical protein
MGLCRGSDSAFPDRQISHTACSVGLVVCPTRVLICAQAIGRNHLELSYVVLRVPSRARRYSQEWIPWRGGSSPLKKKVAPRASVIF